MDTGTGWPHVSDDARSLYLFTYIHTFHQTVRITTVIFS